MSGYVCSECGYTSAEHWTCPRCDDLGAGIEHGHTFDRMCRKCGRDHRLED